MEKYKIYCAGNFTDSGTELEVTDKYAGTTYALTWQADEKLLNTAITEAQKAQKACRELPAYERYRILKTVSERLLADKQRLGTVLSVESAKPIYLAVGE